MDRPKKKLKKPPPPKGDDKGKIPGFHQDLKTIKENLRISEILRNVKISSSFRMKGPKGTKVMTETMNDLTEKHVAADSNENLAHSSSVDDGDEKRVERKVSDHTEAVENSEYVHDEKNLEHDNGDKESSVNTDTFSSSIPGEPTQIEKKPNHVEASSDVGETPDGDVKQHPHGSISDRELNILEDIYEGTSTLPRIQNDIIKPSRKLSLDNTMLRRKGSLSKSEMDLNLVGRMPLQRKSSFFRKKLDSFVKNTSEVFKKQVSTVQGSEQRRGSKSFSLQSLTDKNVFLGDVLLDSKPEAQDSSGSVSAATGSVGSLADSLADSQRSQLDSASVQGSMQSLNELYLNDAIMAGRAYSVSSGLDTVHRPRRSHSTRNNRFTWLASDSVAEYLRRKVEDERALHASHSFQDPRRPAAPTLDSKGRRLSYQRAVSGEDPVLPSRQYDASFRRRSRIPESAELAAVHHELAQKLEEFSKFGVPPLKGFTLAPIGEQSFECIRWAESMENIDSVIDFSELEPKEIERQSVIKELIATEASHITHLRAVVEVFMAAAHALQDAGRLLSVDTAQLFSNIPDVLNASLFFWDTAYQPMVELATFDCARKFNPCMMFGGFQAFRTVLEPYEQFVSEQKDGNDYLRSLQGDPDFAAYLAWCQSHCGCNRLQLADLLAKPMQRLTKYTLLLDRIIAHTDDEDDRAALWMMRNYAKTYVLDVNRYVKQKEEVKKVEELAEVLDGYDVDCKDDEMDRLCKLHSGVNLRGPMPGCLPHHQRSLVYQGDLRMRDHKDQKVDVRVVLMTDMLIITRKNKSQYYSLKVIRPKYKIDQVHHYPQYRNPKNAKEMSSIVCVVTDAVGSAVTCFSLSDPNKDNIHGMKIWEQKIREAKLSYELSVWFAQNATRDISELDPECGDHSRFGKAQSSEEISIERAARERVVTMLPRTNTDLTDNQEDDDKGGKAGPSEQRFPLKRASTGGSSRQSRLSSFQQSSAASHEEHQTQPPKYTFRCGSSVEHTIVPANPDEEPRSITVNVMSENEPEHSMPQRPMGGAPQPHCPSIPTAPPARSRHSLRVLSAMTFVHSLPDLTLELTRHHDEKRQAQEAVAAAAAAASSAAQAPISSTQAPPKTLSASARLYAAHQESLERNRLAAARSSAHYLSPDTRGTSYPPPSPTRASLRRSMAFSYSFKNPPLAKMGHVKSESHHPSEPPLIKSPQSSTRTSPAGPAQLIVPPGAAWYKSPGTDQAAEPIRSESTEAIEPTGAGLATKPAELELPVPSSSCGDDEAINQVLVGIENKKKRITARSPKQSRASSPSSQEERPQ